MESVAKHANSNITKILVGNKCDLDDQRQISYNEGEGLAKQFGLNYFECSAKSGVGIQECFEDLIEMCYNIKYGEEGPGPEHMQKRDTIKLNRRESVNKPTDKKSCKC